ncbi:MAG: HDOD domain-containing protein [Myxococcales bacterium]|nr:HDOD domain-containing protein [Myxococcales bacterium]
MELAEALADAVQKDSVRVPPYPSTAMKLQQVMLRPDFTLHALVDAMRTDAVFTGNILRLANSAFYRRGDPVTSLTLAVSRIGTRELTRLAMAAGVSNAATAAGPLAELRRGVWRRSLTAALVAEALAKVEGTDAGEAFVAGLLHDSGKLLVLGCIEDAFAKRPEVLAASSDIEVLLEQHHAKFGLILSGRWQLPVALAQVIAHHHDAAPPDALTRRVALADRIVEALEAQASVDATALETLTGLPASSCAALAATLPSIPASINAFEGDATPTESAPRAPLVEPVSRPPSSSRAVALTLELKGSAKRVLLDVRHADAHGFVALAKDALQTNRLVEFQVQGSTLKVWAVVQRVRRRGEIHELECSLFAASPEVARQWSRVLEQNERAAA